MKLSRLVVLDCWIVVSLHIVCRGAVCIPVIKRADYMLESSFDHHERVVCIYCFLARQG